MRPEDPPAPTDRGVAFFGAALAGLLSDRLGRRWTIVMGAAVFCLGSALQSGAQSLSYMYPGRIIGGLGVGILVMIVPVYQAEIAHPAIRGRLTGLVQFSLGIGAIVAGQFPPFLAVPERSLRCHG